VKFGLLLDTLERDSLLSLARLAAEEGFDSVWLDEERLAPGGPAAAALVAASAVAASVRGPRIGGVLSLDISHPLYTAEDVAVLDNISGGRTIVAAKPPSDRRAMAAYGIDDDAGRERFAEALEVCLRAWEPTPFRFEGTHFQIPANLPQNIYASEQQLVSVTPKPAQPTVPTWVIATDDAAVGLAARFGLPVLGPADRPVEDVTTNFDLYRSLLHHEPLGSPTALIREIDATDVEGTIAATERWRDDLGVNYLICRLGRPGLSDQETTEAVRLMGRCLIPEFRTYGYPEELRSVSL
jgi:alkanesulfonate monooxygenase SsuD/methylene tetrahydromethanopterin reductase-like flavin-dependent oxidoreductase (luciferase family)